MTPSRRILILSAGCSCGRGAEMNALLVYYSIHYVFDGAKKDPSLEEDSPNPLNVYGASKLAGMQARSLFENRRSSSFSNPLPTCHANAAICQ